MKYKDGILIWETLHDSDLQKFTQCGVSWFPVGLLSFCQSCGTLKNAAVLTLNVFSSSSGRVGLYPAKRAMNEMSCYCLTKLAASQPFILRTETDPLSEIITYFRSSNGWSKCSNKAVRDITSPESFTIDSLISSCHLISYIQ
jgi:hypothetical protein